MDTQETGGGETAEGSSPHSPGSVRDIRPEASHLTHRAAKTETAEHPGESLGAQNERLRKELDDLRAALATQPAIDLARGVLMAVTKCTPREAWEVLVDVSQHTNVKLRDVCRHIVDGVAGPPPPPAERLALEGALRRSRACGGR